MVCVQKMGNGFWFLLPQTDPLTLMRLLLGGCHAGKSSFCGSQPRKKKFAAEMFLFSRKLKPKTVESETASTKILQNTKNIVIH